MSISDRGVLLQKIYDNPDDDLPKLQYVDWVQEWSEDKEELDRVQLIQLAYDIRDSFASDNLEHHRAAGELQSIYDEIIKRNPQWYIKTCPECKSSGVIDNPNRYARIESRPHVLCPVCQGSMSLLNETRRLNNDIHDEIQYESRMNKIEWSMGFIQSIEFTQFSDVWDYKEYQWTDRPHKRLCYILREIPSISRIKIRESDPPKEMQFYQAQSKTYDGKTYLTPTKMVNRWTCRRNSDIPTLIKHSLTNQLRQTQEEAYDDLWMAIVQAVKQWMKQNPKWEEMKG